MNLNARLKMEALILFKNSSLTGRKAFNLVHKKVKNGYYNLSIEEKIECNEEWAREDQRRLDEQCEKERRL